MNSGALSGVNEKPLDWGDGDELGLAWSLQEMDCLAAWGGQTRVLSRCCPPHEHTLEGAS